MNRKQLTRKFVIELKKHFVLHGLYLYKNNSGL